MIWLPYIDECVCFANAEDVKDSHKKTKTNFECNDVGNMYEYVRCKVEREERLFKFTQYVMIQSFEDEFYILNMTSVTPGESGKPLIKSDPRYCVEEKETNYFRKGVGNLLQMMKWSRPEIYNSVRDLSRNMNGVTKYHIKVMQFVMKYLVSTPTQGLELKSERKWFGNNPNFIFKIKGIVDQDFSACKSTRRNVTGYSTFIGNTLVAVKIYMQEVLMKHNHARVAVMLLTHYCSN